MNLIHVIYLLEYITKNKRFIGIRTKFGNLYLDEELEYSTDSHYGTASAVSILGVIDPLIRLETTLETICEKCRKNVNFDMKRPEKDRWRHEDNTNTCEKAWAVSVSNKELFSELEKFKGNKAK